MKPYTAIEHVQMIVLRAIVGIIYLLRIFSSYVLKCSLNYSSYPKRVCLRNDPLLGFEFPETLDKSKVPKLINHRTDGFTETIHVLDLVSIFNLVR